MKIVALMMVGFLAGCSYLAKPLDHAAGIVAETVNQACDTLPEARDGFVQAVNAKAAPDAIELSCAKK